MDCALHVQLHGAYAKAAVFSRSSPASLSLPFKRPRGVSLCAAADTLVGLRRGGAGHRARVQSVRRVCSMAPHERSLTRAHRAEAHDMQSLLFTFLDELLFVFSTEFLVVRTLELHAIDRSNWTMRVVGYAPELS